MSADSNTPITKARRKAAAKTANTRQVRHVFLVVLGMNLLVAVAKIAWGVLTNTLSLSADGFHSLLDATSNLVGIIGLGIAAKPADENHPYGHRKFEALAAMMISFFIFSTCFQILREALDHMLSADKHVASVNWVSYAIVLGTLGVNLFITRFEHKQGRVLKNQLLLTDATHSQSDVFATVAVLASLVCLQLGIPWADAIISLIIAVMISRAGFDVIMVHLGDLTDEAILKSRDVAAVVLLTPGVISCHRIRTRGMTDHIFMDLHIQVNPQISLREAHQISHQVEAAICQTFPGVKDVLVHVEEEGDPDEEDFAPASLNT